YRVAQVQVIFSLPSWLLEQLFTIDQQSHVPQHLAYVEWFMQFAQSPKGPHGLYKIRSSFNSKGYQDSTIVPVMAFRHSIHLYPKFGSAVLPEWTSSSVLDDTKQFYVNSFSDCCCK
ncbi:hypothetical protein Moror_2245, partial [Moniliophthora roreri MCA 2997]